MHPNAELIQKFYTAFQARDANAMIACYHSQIVFSDPVFGRLEGAQATAMWQMLCGRAKDLAITFGDIQADDQSGSAHWEARYTFGKARRAVHNIVDAKFMFQDGLIIQHADTFDLWRWSSMAMGPVGMILGWTPIIQSAIRRNARQGLDEFLKRSK